MHHTAPWSAPALAVALAFTACAPLQPEEAARHGPFATAQAPIIGGSYDPGDPAVVAFGYVSKLNAPGKVYFICSGTLIAPRTVLLAGHCVHPMREPDGTPDTSYEYRVLFTPVARGTDAAQGYPYECRSPCRSVRVARQHRHPGYTSSEKGLRNDLALLELAEPVVGIGPLEPNPEPLAYSDVGRLIRHVGFGQTVAGVNESAGYKTQASYPLSRVYADRLESGTSTAQTCYGDSGGPSLLVTAGSRVERVAGVVSYGESDCAATGTDTRVDAFLPWIRQTMSWEEPPTCAADGACRPGCAPRDADCGGPLEACSADKQCESGRCWTDAQHEGGYCSQACANDAGCPTGTRCAGGTCEKPQKPEVAPGEPCDPDRDFCTGFNVCSAEPGEPTRCATPCRLTYSGTRTCPYSNQQCTLGSHGSYCKDPPATVLPAAVALSGTEGRGCSAVGGSSGAGLLLLPVLALRRARRAALRARVRP